MTPLPRNQPDFNLYLDRIEDVEASDAHFIETARPEWSEFPIDEYQRRYARLRLLMEVEGMDAVLTTQEENVRYFAGYLSLLWVSRFRPYLALLPRDAKVNPSLILPSIERGNALVTSWISDLNVYPPQEDPIAYIAESIRERDLHGGCIGIELGFGQRLGMNQHQFDELNEALPDVEFVDATPLFQSVRMLKSQAELDAVAKASQISEEGVRAGWQALKPGMTERELVSVMVGTMYLLGAEVGTKPSTLACMAGDRWGIPNALAVDYAMKPGDTVMIDAGAAYRGYLCDFIRQAHIGPPDPEHVRLFDMVAEATDAAIEVAAPGVPAHAVYDAAMDSLSRNDLAQFNRQNIVGHGSGLDIHELPWLGEKDRVYSSNVVLRPGMVLSVEPGLVKPMPDGRAGNYIFEEVIMLDRDKATILTCHLPKDLWIV